MSVPSYSLVDEGTNSLWNHFTEMMREMKWLSHDNLTLTLLPSLPSTRCVFATKNKDGKFLGCVVWNEYDEIAWLGMYVCIPVVRGFGIGNKIWARAMERIRETGKTLGLRGVPEMAAKYAARDTPFEVSRLRFKILSCTELRCLCEKLKGDAGIRMKSELNAAQIEELYTFDQNMTGRDRRDILIPFFSSPSFECAVLFNQEGDIEGWAGINSVGLEREQLFKLAPVYASSLSQFAQLSQALLPFCERTFDDPKIVISTLSGTAGERQMEPLLRNYDSKSIERVTMFSDRVHMRLNKDACFSPHNTIGHFDG